MKRCQGFVAPYQSCILEDKVEWLLLKNVADTDLVQLLLQPDAPFFRFVICKLGNSSVVGSVWCSGKKRNITHSATLYIDSRIYRQSLPWQVLTSLSKHYFEWAVENKIIDSITAGACTKPYNRSRQPHFPFKTWRNGYKNVRMPIQYITNLFALLVRSRAVSQEVLFRNDCCCKKAWICWHVTIASIHQFYSFVS